MSLTMPSRTASLPLPRWWLLAALPAFLLLSGCDMLGLETPGMATQRQAAEARAVGAACRHAVRSIEDCFASNPRLSRAEIFEGWREMDQHMRDNDIQGMPHQPAPAAATPPPPTPRPAAPGTAVPGGATPGTVALPARPGLTPPVPATPPAAPPAPAR